MGFETISRERLERALGPIGAQALIEERGMGPPLARNPSLADTIGAAWRQENLLWAFSEWASEPDFREDPAFQFKEEALPERLKPYSERLSGALSQPHLDYLIQKADAELDRREIIAASGTGAALLAYGIAGVASPETLLPFGTGLKAAMALKTGIRTAAMLGGAVAAAEQATAEAFLNRLQLTRTDEEAKINVLTAAVMGSILGSAGGAIGKARRAVIDDVAKTSTAVSKADEEFFRIYESKLTPDRTAEMDDAEVVRVAQEEVIARHPELQRMVGTTGSLAARTWGKLIGLTPGLRGRLSDSTVMRIATNKVSQTGIVTGKKKTRARMPSVEAEVGLVQYRGIQSVSDVADTYRGYRKKTTSDTRMDQADFFHNVVEGARRETIDENTGKSTGKWDPPTSDPHGIYRSLDVNDPVAVAALRSGISRFRKFQEEIRELGDRFSGHLTFSDWAPGSVARTANSYVHRVYKLSEIIARRHEFLEVLRQGMKATNPELKINEDELLSVIQKIEGATDATGQLSFSDAMGEARTLGIRDDFVADIGGKAVRFSEFLDNDLASLISKQIHVFVPRMILARRMAGPAHARALALRDTWEGLMKRVAEAKDDELPELAVEVNKLVRQINDATFLEVAHGQGTRKWENRAQDYIVRAQTRDELMGELAVAEKEMAKSERSLADAEDHLDNRMKIDRLILGSLQNEREVTRDGKKVKRTYEDLILEKVRQRAAGEARKKTLSPEAKQIAKAMEIAEGQLGKVERRIKRVMEGEAATEVVELDRELAELGQTMRQFEIREAELRAMSPEELQAPRQPAPPATAEEFAERIEEVARPPEVRELKEMTRKIEAEAASPAPRRTGAQNAELAEVRRAAVQMAGEAERIKELIAVRREEVIQKLGLGDPEARAKEMGEMKQRVSALRKMFDEATAQTDVALARRLWLDALHARRVRGGLASTYKYARSLIAKDEYLRELSREAASVRTPDPGAMAAHVALRTRELATRKAARDEARNALKVVEGGLIRLRRQAKKNIRSEDAGNFLLKEPRPIKRLRGEAVTKEAIGEILSEQFTRISAVRQRLARNAESLRWWKRQVRQDWDRKIKKAAGAGNGSLARKFQYRKERDLKDLDFMVRQIVGAATTEEENLGLQGSRLLRQFNYVTKMGGMMLSSIPDVAMGVFVAGLGPWMKMVARFLRDPRLKSLSKEELSQILVASEMTMGSMRASRIGDIADLTGGLNRAEGVLGKMAAGMTKWSGMARWNATMKGFASVAIAQRMNQVVRSVAGGTGSKVERQFLELSGISDEMAERIVKQLDQHAEKEMVFGMTVEYPKTQDWTDRTAREVYQAAMIQNVHRTIITPGAGELPRAIDNGAVRLLLQFRSFAIAASQQILLSGGQRFFSTGDVAVVQGLLALLFMGAVTEWVKTSINQGHEKGNELLGQPGKLLVNSIDRSGMLGIFGDVNAVVERLSLGNVGLSAIHGEDGQVSRYSSRNLLSAVAGPSLGQLQSLAQLATMPARWAEGQAAASDLTNIRELLPYQNLWQVRLLLDDIAPRVVTGERRRLERWALDEEDVKEINAAWERLALQPALE